MGVFLVILITVTITIGSRQRGRRLRSRARRYIPVEDAYKQLVRAPGSPEFMLPPLPDSPTPPRSLSPPDLTTPTRSRRTEYDLRDPRLNDRRGAFRDATARRRLQFESRLDLRSPDESLGALDRTEVRPVSSDFAELGVRPLGRRTHSESDGSPPSDRIKSEKPSEDSDADVYNILLDDVPSSSNTYVREPKQSKPANNADTNKPENTENNSDDMDFQSDK